MTMKVRTATTAGANRAIGRDIARAFARGGERCGGSGRLTRPRMSWEIVSRVAADDAGKDDSMRCRRNRILYCALGVAAFGAAATSMRTAAQAFPAKPIRLVTAEAGGGNDFAARAIARGIGDSMGQQWVVDNRGGAGGIIAAEIVARAAPDGHTLLVYAGNIWIIPLLKKQVPYSMARDFAPVTWAARSPSTLVVHPSLPVRTVRELIALAKAKPGQLNYGSGGTGSSTHLAVELFKSMAKVDIARVAYRGNAPAINDLIAGQIQLMIATAGSVAPHAGSGRLRALAVTSAQPTPLAPGLPTIASAGLPGYETLSIYGVFAPSKTPAAVVQRLNHEITRVLHRADIKQLFLNAGVETVGSTAEAFAAVIKADSARMGKVIVEAGIRGD